MTPEELDELEEQLKDNIDNSDYTQYAVLNFKKCLEAITFLRQELIKERIVRKVLQMKKSDKL